VKRNWGLSKNKIKKGGVSLEVGKEDRIVRASESGSERKREDERRCEVL
jgi:hypothetical protein